MRVSLLFSLLAASPLWAASNIVDIPNQRGARITGIAANLGVGSALAGVGDLNKDGRADIAVGAPFTSRAGAVNVGAVYVYFGADAPGAALNATALNGANGFKISADTQAANTLLGALVRGVGDVNNDDVDDLLITTNAQSPSRVYLLFGKPTGQSFPAVLDVGALGSAGVVFNGEGASDQFGAAIGGGGDVNGDGIDDLVIGAPGFAGQSGRSYLIFGRATWPASMLVGNEPGTSVSKINAAASADQLGAYVSIGADINNDQRAELFLNGFASDASSGGNEGVLYVLFGRASANPWPAASSVSALNGSNGFAFSGVGLAGGFGFPGLSLGDFNGDGIGDFAASTPGFAGNTRGQIAVVYGSANFSASFSVGGLNGTDGTRFVGAQLGDQAGFDLAAPGDLNADGRTDLLIAAPGADPDGISNAGRVYVIYGPATPFAAEVSLAEVGRGQVFGELFNGSTANFQAGTVASVGKFSNADASADFLIGSLSAAGDAYLVYRARDEFFRDGFENAP